MTTRTPRSTLGSFWRTTLAVVLVILLGAAVFVFVPLNGYLPSNPQPVKDYVAAVQHIEALRATESSGYNPVCQVQFMTHGQKVDRVLVIAHGYTSCPEQFRPLGEKFYALGYNVLIAPLPHHGLADRLTDDQSLLTAEEVTRYTDNVMDIAQGLGNHVTMMGISGGGAATAWAAQERSDLDLAVLISPAFGYHLIPTNLTAAAMNYYLIAPNSYTWWNPQLKDQRGPDYSYPRYSTRALAQLLRVSFAAELGAQRTAPAAHSILVVTNGNDTSVNNVLTYQVTGYWRDHGANVRTYEFDAGLKLGHDLIDPNKDDQRVDIVFPQLIKLVTQ